MAVTVENSGTVTTDGSEQTLGSAITSAKVLQLQVNTVNLVNSDALKVTIYVKAASGGTERILFQEEYADIQAEPVKISAPVPSPYSWKATVTRTAGTDRAYEWAIVSV